MDNFGKTLREFILRRILHLMSPDGIKSLITLFTVSGKARDAFMKGTLDFEQIMREHPEIQLDNVEITHLRFCRLKGTIEQFYGCVDGLLDTYADWHD